MWRRPDAPDRPAAGDRAERFDRYLQVLFARGVWTRAQIVRKLTAKGASGDEAEALAGRWQQGGFIDDAAYALLFVDGHPGWGVRRLRDELRRRGVSEAVIGEALEELDEERAALSTAREWLESGVERRKVEDRLLRRGFSPSAVRRALAAFAGDDL
ncbi:MAG TPA: hypothetical protein DIC53_05215 [Synergistaceae bacterium]|nr:hypothetical protein [Synergistaceae bacterium]